MKIIHISTVHNPLDQRILYRECFSLKQAGYQVYLLAHGNPDDFPRDIGVKFISLGPWKKQKGRLELLTRWCRVRRALKKAIDLKADTYHFHDPELIPVGLKLKRQTKAKVIYDCHEDNIGFISQKKSIPKVLRGIFKRWMLVLEKKAASKMDAIVTADDGVAEYFSKMNASRIRVVYNFPRLDLFPVARKKIEKKYDLVYHGTVPKYHIEEIFSIDHDLVQRGVYVKWLIFGKIACLNWAKKEAEQRQCAQRFHFGGLIPHAEVADKVREARIGIIPLPDLPKFQHNIPTKLFEFMALKMPTILSDLPPSRKLLAGTGYGYLIPPGDSEAYAEAIYQLMKNPELSVAQGSLGADLVQNKFNWDSQSSKLTLLYDELLKK